jgi:general secretion pathway protein D
MSLFSRPAAVAVALGLSCCLVPLLGHAAEPAAANAPVSPPKTANKVKKTEQVKKELPPSERQITMDFQDVDLGVLVKFVSEITHKNFIVDDKVKGKVTVISPEKISVDEAYQVFLSVLQVKGFTTVPSGAVIKIVPSKEAKTSTVPTILPKGVVSPNDEFVTRLIPLSHVDANNMVSILQPMVSPEGLLAAYGPTNTLILIDTAAQTDRLAKILTQLDVEGFERAIEVIRLNYAFATDMAATLAQVLEEESEGQAPTPARAPRAPRLPVRRGAAPTQATVAGGSTPASSFKIIPDERTNTLIVLAGPLEMRRIKELIAKLDVPLPLGTGRIHVYYLKYANALEMVAVLSNLIGGGGAGGGGGFGGIGAGLAGRGLGGAGAFRGGGVGGLGGLGGGLGGLGGVGGLGGSSLSSFGSSMSGFGSSLSGSRLGGTQAGGFGRTGFGGIPGQGGLPGTGGAASAGNESVRITADPATNALIINATPQDYETLKDVIEKLDVRRRQVYVEAIILEVRLDKSRSLGFDFQGGTGLGEGVGLARTNLTGNLNAALTNPASIGGLVMAAASNQTVRLPDGSTVPAQVALFSALQNDSDVNILSAPNLLTTDNQEAEIVVGENLPFVASVSTSETNLANTFNTVDRRDVGITLRITPQISEGGTVRLDLFEEVSAVIPTATTSQTANLGPSTTIRSATTTVVARDSQTVVIGGLISDDTEHSRSQVPFLGDIPVLGHLLRSASSTRQKVNLLIFLTPHIIRTEEDQRRISLQRRDQMKAFMQEQRFPNRRSEFLDTPSWDTLPPPAEGGELNEDGSRAPKHDSLTSEPLSVAPPSRPRYVLLASFFSQGQPPPSLISSSGLLPIVLADDSDLRSLFAPGKTFRFESDTYSAVYRCLDTFETAQAARVVYPEGLRVSAEPQELLHWRQLNDASSRNESSWTRVN